MSVYRLKSGNEFISLILPNRVMVCLFKGVSNNYWEHQVDVGPVAEKYNALEVFGTTFEGDKLAELIKDLEGIEGDHEGSNVYVNRLGLCLTIVHCYGEYDGEDDHQLLRIIDDRFLWSKYGVELPNDYGNGELRRRNKVEAVNNMLSFNDVLRYLDGGEETTKEREKKVEVVNNLLLSFNAALRYLG